MRIALPAVAAVLCLLSANLAAQDAPRPTDPDDAEEARRYQVEFIVFRYGAGVSAGTEVFVPEAPADEIAVDGLTPGGTLPGDQPLSPEDGSGRPPSPDGLPATEDAAEAIPVFGDTDGYAEAEPIDGEMDLAEIITAAASIDLRVMPADALTLADTHEKLLRLDAYEPLLWSGWTQIVRDQSASPALDIRRFGNVPLSVDGTLTLYLGRFVHLVVDLSMQADTSTGTIAGTMGGTAVAPAGAMDASRSRFDRAGLSGYGAAAPQIVYRISEDRIMRNGDIRYFDHPKLGLIAKLSLVESAPADGDPLDDGVLPAPQAGTDSPAQ